MTIVYDKEKEKKSILNGLYKTYLENLIQLIPNNNNHIDVELFMEKMEEAFQYYIKHIHSLKKEIKKNSQKYNNNDKNNNEELFFRFVKQMVIQYPLFHRIIPFEHIKEEIIKYIQKKKKEAMIGCILLDEKEEHILILNEKMKYCKHYAWTFPMEYIQKEKNNVEIFENDDNNQNKEIDYLAQCIFEKIGINISDKIQENDFTVQYFKKQKITLYIIRNIPKDKLIFFVDENKIKDYKWISFTDIESKLNKDKKIFPFDLSNIFNIKQFCLCKEQNNDNKNIKTINEVEKDEHTGEIFVYNPLSFL